MGRADHAAAGIRRGGLAAVHVVGVGHGPGGLARHGAGLGEQLARPVVAVVQTGEAVFLGEHAARGVEAAEDGRCRVAPVGLHLPVAQVEGGCADLPGPVRVADAVADGVVAVLLAGTARVNQLGAAVEQVVAVGVRVALGVGHGHEVAGRVVAHRGGLPLGIGDRDQAIHGVVNLGGHAGVGPGLGARVALAVVSPAGDVAERIGGGDPPVACVVGERGRLPEGVGGREHVVGLVVGHRRGGGLRRARADSLPQKPPAGIIREGRPASARGRDRKRRAVEGVRVVLGGGRAPERVGDRRHAAEHVVGEAPGVAGLVGLAGEVAVERVGAQPGRAVGVGDPGDQPALVVIHAGGAAEGVGHQGEPVRGVVAVGGGVAERVHGTDEQSALVVFGAFHAAVAQPVGGHLAKRVVFPGLKGAVRVIGPGDPVAIVAGVGGGASEGVGVADEQVFFVVTPALDRAVRVGLGERGALRSPRVGGDPAERVLLRGHVTVGVVGVKGRVVVGVDLLGDGRPGGEAGVVDLHVPAAVAVGDHRLVEAVVVEPDGEDGPAGREVDLGGHRAEHGSGDGVLVDGPVTALAQIVADIVPLAHQRARPWEHLHVFVAGLGAVAVARAGQAREGVWERRVVEGGVIVGHRAAVAGLDRGDRQRRDRGEVRALDSHRCGAPCRGLLKRLLAGDAQEAHPADLARRTEVEPDKAARLRGRDEPGVGQPVEGRLRGVGHVGAEDLAGELGAGARLVELDLGDLAEAFVGLDQAHVTEGGGVVDSELRPRARGGGRAEGGQGGGVEPVAGERRVTDAKRAAGGLGDLGQLPAAVVFEAAGVPGDVPHLVHEVIDRRADRCPSEAAALAALLDEKEVFPVGDEFIGQSAHRGPHPGSGLHEGELRAAGVNNRQLSAPRRVGRGRGQLVLETVPPVMAHAEKAAAAHRAGVAVTAPGHRNAAHGAPDLQIVHALELVARVGDHRVALLGRGHRGIGRIWRIGRSMGIGISVSAAPAGAFISAVLSEQALAAHERHRQQDTENTFHHF